MPEIPESCRRWDEHLSAFIDAELDDALARELGAHAEGCSRCQQRLSALRRVDERLAQTPVPALPAGLHQRLGERLAGQASTRRRPAAPRTTRRWLSRPAIGVAVAAAAALALYLALPAREDTLPSAPAARVAERPSPAPEPVQLAERPVPSPALPTQPVPEPRIEPPVEVARIEPEPQTAPEVDLDAVPEEELELLLELETLEDLEMIANLELLEQLLALEEGAG